MKKRFQRVQVVRRKPKDLYDTMLSEEPQRCLDQAGSEVASMLI